MPTPSIFRVYCGQGLALGRGKNIRGSKGFTLIELLVVISIIGVLVAVLLPVISTARDLAQSVKCTAQLRALFIATVNYGNDFKQCYPVRSYEGVSATNSPGYDAATMGFQKVAALDPGNWWSYRNWMSLLMAYHGSNGAMICPAATYRGYGFTYGYAAGLGPSVKLDGTYVPPWFSFAGEPPNRMGQEVWPGDTKILYGDCFEGSILYINTYPYSLMTAGSQDAPHRLKNIFNCNVMLVNGTVRTLANTHPVFGDPAQTAFYLKYATSPGLLPLQ